MYVARHNLQKANLQKACLLGSLLLIGSEASAGDEADTEYASFWLGGGVGTMLTGEGAVYANGHKMGMLSVTMPKDKIKLRLMKGSFERTQGIEEGTGDNDIDYEGFDVVVTPVATNLPVSLAFGLARYEEAYHVGYPDRDLGGSEFVHRWGPHVSALHSWPLGRFFEVWAETDLHYIPYESKQTLLLLNIGAGARF
jgi:hypothetical protein